MVYYYVSAIRVLMLGSVYYPHMSEYTFNDQKETKDKLLYDCWFFSLLIMFGDFFYLSLK